MRATSQQPKHSQYAAEDHLPEWMLMKASTAKAVWATSPYVTDARLFRAAKEGDGRLYLDFSAMHFIAGASSLKVLKTLHQIKVNLYHAECLHAKVVLIDTACFSVGSQNLTLKGRNTNREASFISGKDASPTEVLAFFKRVQARARLITQADIVAMEKFVAPWLAKFKLIRNAGAGIDSQIKAAYQKREAAEHARRRAIALANKRMKRARQNLERLLRESELTPTNHLFASVRTIYHPLNELSWHGIGKGSTDSLAPCNPRQNFGALFKGTGVWPRQLHRYLVVNEDTGQLGYVRFAKTRWTFFADGVENIGKVRLGEHELRVDITFDWQPSKNSLHNGVATLRSCDDPKDQPVVATVDFALNASGVELGEIECTGVNTAVAGELASPTKHAASAKQCLKKLLFMQLTKPFVFKHNLLGCEASRFFGECTKVRVQLHLVGQRVIFSVRQASAP